MALNVHAQNVSGMCAHFVSIVCQLDAASFAASTHLHLCFHNNWISSCFGCGNCLIDGDGDVTFRYRNVVARKVLLALILKKIHELLPIVEFFFKPLTNRFQR